ncbi:hypothetical protein LCGC14_0716400 [marine sediment metagenome]|uniref:Acetyltransferase n=1 Tax=marine sediment metagenome TaxID=412755 RepID=A0A0F9SZ78_9ZZZZ
MNQEINVQRLEFVMEQRKKYPMEWNIKTLIPDWVTIGKRTDIHPGVFFSDQGFGFQWDGTEYVRIPHVGELLMEDKVEIFSGTNIVRPTLSVTFIGEGTKIDYNCHIAHNVKIGKHCLIIAGTILGGSVTIGNNCYLGIGCMIKNKVKIGNNVTIGMGAVVLNDVPDNYVMIGNPAKFLRNNAS